MSSELHFALHFIIWVIILTGVFAAIFTISEIAPETFEAKLIGTEPLNPIAVRWGLIFSLIIYIPIEIIYWILYSIIF